MSSFVAFETAQQLLVYLCDRWIPVIGIEISPRSVSLQDLSFMASIAFMPG